MYSKKVIEKEKFASKSSPPGNYFMRNIFKIWSLWFVATFTTVWNTILFDVFQKCPTLDMSNRKSGNICVITGGSRGIGLEIVKKLLKLDYTVIAGVRNINFMEKQIQKIRKYGGTSGHIKVLNLDLKSLRSVKNFAKTVLELPNLTGIDLLINNAGIHQNEFEITEDGLEANFQVNYLSHYLLTKLLLPVIKHTSRINNATCHIVNLSSCYHQNGNVRKRLDNLVNPNLFVPIHCYFDTKLCLVMHAKSIQAQLENEGVHKVQMYAVHPGNIPTEMWSNTLGYLKPITVLLKLIFRTAESAADVVLYPAVCPDIMGGCGGKYFDTGRAVTCNTQAEDLKLRNRLEEISEALTAAYLSDNGNRTNKLYHRF